MQKTLGLAQNEPFAYTIESTALYHMPVLLTFGATPSVVNPLLAGHTRRKTDVLDARLLARQAITGLWRASYLAFPAQTDLRVLWSEHSTAQRAALRACLKNVAADVSRRTDEARIWRENPPTYVGGYETAYFSDTL